MTANRVDSKSWLLFIRVCPEFRYKRHAFLLCQTVRRSRHFAAGSECHFVSSVMLSENVSASLEIAETRCPGLTLTRMTQLGGNSVPAVELTAASFGLTTATRHPAVDETEPG